MRQDKKKRKKCKDNKKRRKGKDKKKKKMMTGKNKRKEREKRKGEKKREKKKSNIAHLSLVPMQWHHTRPFDGRAETVVPLGHPGFELGQCQVAASPVIALLKLVLVIHTPGLA